jgi:hypothetical protein
MLIVNLILFAIGSMGCGFSVGATWSLIRRDLPRREWYKVLLCWIIAGFLLVWSGKYLITH